MTSSVPSGFENVVWTYSMRPIADLADPDSPGSPRYPHGRS